jgi:hypothetical protein
MAFCPAQPVAPAVMRVADNKRIGRRPRFFNILLSCVFKPVTEYGTQIILPDS